MAKNVGLSADEIAKQNTAGKFVQEDDSLDSDLEEGSVDFADILDQLRALEDDDGKGGKDTEDDFQAIEDMRRERMDEKMETDDNQDSLYVASSGGLDPINFDTPGLSVFKSSKFCQTFESKDLNLMKHFGYIFENPAVKRFKLLRKLLHDKGNPVKPEKIFEDPVGFIGWLAPESSSLLIGNPTEFAQICDYLFYFTATCSDKRQQIIYKKALFDLLKNYAFEWKLTLSHLVTVFHNFGMYEPLYTDKNTLKDVFAQQIESVNQRRKAIQDPNEFTVEPPNFAEFYSHISEERKNAATSEDREKPKGEVKKTEHEEKSRISMIDEFISLVVEIIAGLSGRSEFQPVRDADIKNGHVPQLFLMYLFLYIAVDKELMDKGKNKNLITSLFHYQFNSFDSDTWLLETKASDSSTQQYNGVFIDICHVFTWIGEDVKALYNWSQDNVPKTKFFETFDHHQNCYRRLQLLPSSYRGSMVKRCVALIYVQVFLQIGQLSLTPHVDMTSLAQLLRGETSGGVSVLATVKVLHKYDFLMFNIIRFFDVVIGCDEREFQTDVGRNSIKFIKDEFNSYGMKLRNRKDLDALKILELWETMLYKWDILIGENAGF